MSLAGAGRRLAGFLTLICLLSLAGFAKAAEIGFKPIELRVSPIEAFGRGLPDPGFPMLEFRGGLELASPDPDFGALSGLDHAPDGSLVAVADTAFWFTAKPVVRDGRLIDLIDPRLAPILDTAGRPLTGKRAGDAEGLRIVGGDRRLEAYVSFEGRNDVRRYVASPDLARARANPLRLPKSVSGLNPNSGLEAIAIAPQEAPFSGAIVLIAEHSLDSDGNHRGWIVGGRRAGAFSVKRSDDFDVTDAVFLPKGDLLILERRFNFIVGVGMRIRRIAAADLLPGRTVDGRVIAEADMRHQIDNMEGMALNPGGNGESIITLISDDNNSIFQRTILLQFALPADALPKPRRRPDIDR